MQRQPVDREKKPAVFLDRDGVLTEERSYITSIEDLCVFSYAAECIRQIHEKGYYAIVITNQSAVARGLLSEKTLQEMNAFLIHETGVDAVYYCPHHPEAKIGQYRKACHCRKPETGLFEKAGQQFAVDMARSWMVGDRASDIAAGQRAGLRTILLESGYGTVGLELNVEADYVLDDLRNIIEIL